MSKVILFVSFLFFASSGWSQLWHADQSWSLEWENKFSAWIENEVQEDFLHKYNIQTDCADALISLRWIFARINKLPVVSTSSRGEKLHHELATWNKYKTHQSWWLDERFLKALNDVNSTTSTRTLLNDTYPIELLRSTLVVGTLYITSDHDSGHAEWIQKLEMTGTKIPLTFFSSTVPKQVRRFLVYPLVKTKWPQAKKSGFMKFRWPQKTQTGWSLTDAKNMPHYSLEQYESDVRNQIDFDDYVTEKILGHSLDGVNKFFSLASHLVDRLEKRAAIVDEGFKACRAQCKENSSQFYNYSTYSRDAAILFLIQGINEMIYSTRYRSNIDDAIASDIQLKWSQFQTSTEIDMGIRKAALGEIIFNWNENRFSSNPNDAIEKRWGF